LNVEEVEVVMRIVKAAAGFVGGDVSTREKARRLWNLDDVKLAM
jgi:heptaprenylglyceryl phosphate synthase